MRIRACTRQDIFEHSICLRNTASITATIQALASYKSASKERGFLHSKLIIFSSHNFYICVKLLTNYLEPRRAYYCAAFQVAYAIFAMYQFT